MKVRTTVFVFVLCLGLLAGCIAPIDPNFQPNSNSEQVEPQAGEWKTWVLTSVDEVRPAAPPDQAATAAEIEVMKDLAAQADATVLEQVAYWNAGSPSYRWNEIAAQIITAELPPTWMSRTMALMNIAIYDAMVAAWDAKYSYNRSHPSKVEPSLVTLIPNPASPSYPSEHAVAAGAASEILAYVFPDRAQSFRDQAQAAADSRVLAGVNFPSDVEAGLALGRAVAEQVIEHAMADGSDAPWTGTVPQGPGMWVGDTPSVPLMGSWKTWVLENGSQFRLDPPPAIDSPEMLAELAEVENFERTVPSTMAAYYWQSDESYFYFFEWTSRHIFEQKWDDNPPRAARVYALISVAGYDALVACFDTKYTYWLIRPSQLDPAITTLFPPPPHPSYPSGHACNSGATANVLAYLFPADGEAVIARAENAADSRIWAGIHYPIDRDGGLAIARGVADLVIEWAESDGSEVGR